MKLEIPKDRLATAVSKTEKIAGKNLSLPVLSCLYIEAKKNTLIIKATNLELGVEISLPAKIEKDGVVAVPASVLNSFLVNLNDGDNITLNVLSGNLHVSTKHTSTTIKTLPPDDFPTIPHVSGTVVVAPAQEFVKGFRSVWFSAAVSSIKPELSSVYVYSDNDGVVFAATDSFRLAEKRVRLKKPVDFGQILVPHKNIPEVVKILSDYGGDVKLTVDKNQISFSYDDVYLTSRVIDGVFPDYKQIIPENFSTEAVVLKQDLINALKIANIFSDNFHQLHIKAIPSKKNFELQTTNTNVGENKNSIAAVFKGEDISINFNYKYIVDCFSSLESDSVSLQFNGFGRPMVIRGVSDTSFLYLVMPMNK